MNKKGMTLIELLVYMAIAALLLTPVIMLMQNSSVNMARDAANTDLRISGRDILNIMYDDIKNTGFKLKSHTGDTSAAVTFAVWNNAANPPVIISDDPSSIRPGDGAEFDTLTIRMGRLINKPNDPNHGKWDGYNTIMFYVSSGTIDTLIRVDSAYTYDPNDTYTPPNKPKRNAIAQNVEALQFQYSKDLENWYDGNKLVLKNPNTVEMLKGEVKYIKISIITIDKKKLSATRTSPAIPIGNYTYPADNSNPSGQYLRELNEIVVPIPNNGRFP